MSGFDSFNHGWADVESTRLAVDLRPPPVDADPCAGCSGSIDIAFDSLLGRGANNRSQILTRNDLSHLNLDGIEDRLTALEQASHERRAELRRLAAQLPAAVSRRALLVEAARDLRRAPNKTDIARRGLAKLTRLPAALVRRITR